MTNQSSCALQGMYQYESVEVIIVSHRSRAPVPLPLLRLANRQQQPNDILK